MTKTKRDAKAIIGQQPIAALVTMNEDGFPVERAMYTSTVTDDFTVYFVTVRDAEKCKQISRNPGVATVWPTTGGYLSLTGEAFIQDDEASRNAAWKSSFIKYFPGGISDPTYVVIKIIPRTLAYYEFGVMDVEVIDLS